MRHASTHGHRACPGPRAPGAPGPPPSHGGDGRTGTPRPRRGRRPSGRRFDLTHAQEAEREAGRRLTDFCCASSPRACQPMGDAEAVSAAAACAVPGRGGRERRHTRFVGVTAALGRPLQQLSTKRSLQAARLSGWRPRPRSGASTRCTSRSTGASVGPFVAAARGAASCGCAPARVRKHADAPLLRRKLQTRVLHVVGTAGFDAVLVAAAVKRSPKLVPLALLLGYGFAWVGHFVFERNRCAAPAADCWSARRGGHADLIGAIQTSALGVRGRPTTFKYPIWSAIADHVMCFNIVTGREPWAIK